MSVLRKKIDNALVEKPLNNQEAEKVYLNFQTKILSTFEDLIEPLIWKAKGLKVKELSTKDLPKSFPKAGLFATWGETDKETQNLVLLDIKLAGLISRFGFQGEITDLKKLDKHPVSKFDILLLEDFLSLAKSVFMPDSSQYRKDYTEFSGIPFSPECQDWVRLDFEYCVSLGAKSDPIDFTVSLLLSRMDYDSNLKRTPKSESANPTIEFDENAETLTRHIDMSITPLRAVLESCEMTVADCTRLSIGQVIPLPGVSLQELNIEAELKDNRMCIAKGALGIHKTRRAVQLVENISPHFLDEGLASLID